MKILYLGISSKFIHTMPAGWFLAEYLKEKGGIDVTEIYHNVNEPLERVAEDVLSYDFDTLLVSVYIFNVEYLKKLLEQIKEIRPGIKIIAGGPEADENFPAGHIILGEGERALLRLLKEGGQRIVEEEPIQNLDDIPSPYTAERLKKSEHKLIYYESSRGCPYRCSYCMAGLSKGVRYFSLDHVKKDLTNIVAAGVKIVKFTDRTFNADTKRTEEILTFIKDNFSDKDICFHFEIGGDLFKESTLNLLSSMPKGLIQFEAGVQTLNEDSLKAVSRPHDSARLLENIKKVIGYGNIHTHLDLIAGLPYETKDTFIDSFNKIFALRPHKLQLGFLKYLKGTPIREKYPAHYVVMAPYEVKSTPTMRAEDFAELKKVEFSLDKLYNSGKFIYALEHILRGFNSPYAAFLALADFLYARDLKRNISENGLYGAVLDFLKSNENAKDILKFDYLISNKSRRLPEVLKSPASEAFSEFLKTRNKDKDTFYAEFNYLAPEDKSGHFTVKFDYSEKDKVKNVYRYQIMR